MNRHHDQEATKVSKCFGIEGVWEPFEEKATSPGEDNGPTTAHEKTDYLELYRTALKIDLREIPAFALKITSEMGNSKCGGELKNASGNLRANAMVSNKSSDASLNPSSTCAISVLCLPTSPANSA